MKKPDTPLARFRADKGVTLEALGDSLGVNKSTVLRWEWKTVPIPLNKLAKLEELTGISRHELRPDIFGVSA